jgi:hypothetical protein
VRVRILTRPPEEPGGGTTDEVGEVVCALRDLGVAVDLRARMHEKIAVLDDRILWHGSLNLLSHRDTRESMLRIESPRPDSRAWVVSQFSNRGPTQAPTSRACLKLAGDSMAAT